MVQSCLQIIFHSWSNGDCSIKQRHTYLSRATSGKRSDTLYCQAKHIHIGVSATQCIVGKPPTRIHRKGRHDKIKIPFNLRIVGDLAHAELPILVRCVPVCRHHENEIEKRRLTDLIGRASTPLQSLPARPLCSKPVAHGFREYALAAMQQWYWCTMQSL